MKNHLRRLASPKTWKVKRKKAKWITRPRSGAHCLIHSISLNTLLQEILHLSTTARESRKILDRGSILINGDVQKDPKFGVGFLDVISIPSQKKHYRIILNTKNHIGAIEIKEQEAHIMPLQIVGKTILKKKKIQLNFTHGENRIMGKESYHVHDTILLSVKNKEILDHFACEKGSLVFFTGGSHVGEMGKIEDIKKTPLSPPKLVFSQGAKRFTTDLKYGYVIGKDKPSIMLTK